MDLLNVLFQDLTGTFRLRIFANSIDNIQGSSGWKYSKDYPMGQINSIFFVGNNGDNKPTNLEQCGVYSALKKAGYGDGVCLLQNISQIGVKMYLNGRAVDEQNNPQPYVVFENNDGTHAILNYYRGDNTLIGTVFTYQTSYIGCFTGKLDKNGRIHRYGEDGGDQVYIRAHYNAGIISKKYYDWYKDTHYGPSYADIGIINSSVLADIDEYLPIEPEGFASDPGQGDFDDTSDPIGIPGVPGINVLQTGFVRMYEMTSSQLQALANLLWDQSTFTNLIVKNFQDPFEAVLNLCMCPVEFTGLTSQNIAVGNVAFNDVEGQALTTPYKRIDFGIIWLNEFWGSYADYSPNTKISIFLPYCGVQNLNVDDVMNGAINLWANCDVFTGSIQYFLYSQQSNHMGHGHQSVLYTWSGNMKYNMPVSGSNFNRQIISAVSNTIANTITTGEIPAGSMNPLTNLGKSHIQRGGGWGGMVGALGHQYPFLILERPEVNLTNNYEHTIGIPNENDDYLSNYTGYIKVRGVHMNISGATSNELNEIESILKAGVII